MRHMTVEWQAAPAKLTLASNIGTFLVHGSTCIVALVGLASRAE